MIAPALLHRPIFIVGPGRSGTTLLRSLLSAHPGIAVTPETKFMSRAQDWGLDSGAPADFETFWADYTAWLRFRDLGVDADHCRKLMDAQQDYSFAGIFRAVLAAYGEKAGKIRVGEKTPSHVRHLSLLLQWFPDAQVLVTQRDPRAVVASQINTYYIRKTFRPRTLRGGIFAYKREESLAYWAKQWATDFETWLKPWRGDPRFYTVVYERLVRDAESEVRAIFDFLGEDFEPSVLTDRSDVTVPAHAAQDDDRCMEQWRIRHHQETLKDISAVSIDKWKEELSKPEIALIEGCCADTMRNLGYTPSLPFYTRVTAKAAGIMLRAAAATETRARELSSQRSRAVREAVGTALGKAASTGVKKGLSPAWFGYRRVVHESVEEYFSRHGNSPGAGTYETVHPQSVAQNPLPCNIASRNELPADRGWWGYSFYDVPQRTSDESFIATLPNCLLTWYRDPHIGNDFYPAILNSDRRAIDMREVRFRPGHGATLRQSDKPVKLKRATWFVERVYHNHSHWLTAHLPKLLLLRERGALDEVLLPPERTAAMDGSLSMLGLEPDDFQTWDPSRPLLVEELTIMGTDRFRPELLQKIPTAFGISAEDEPDRKVFISRLHAARRRLLNEDEVWAILAPLGFERVLMEDLTFAEQVRLMSQTAVLVAPHGAGLTNMVFCPSGAHIIEIADLGFPNPNFYALAAAMGHNYWLARAESVGNVHPLEKDLKVDPAAVDDILRHLLPGYVPSVKQAWSGQR